MSAGGKEKQIKRNVTKQSMQSKANESTVK